MYNIFEQAVLPTHTVAPHLLEQMRQSGAVGAMMSGSGPSVFGLFESEAAARTAAERIERELGIRAFVANPVEPRND
jgi:4-diphosphocytidyl-2-C-methyl-D-erythritol kinase